MKAILNLDGFTKLIDIDGATPFVTVKITMDSKEMDVVFLKLETKMVDNEEIAFYKMFEPTVDIGIKL